MIRRTALLSLATLLAGACADRAGTPLEPREPAAARDVLPGSPGDGADRSEAIVAMTRNLYLGTDVFAVAAVPPEQVPLAVGAAWAQVVASDPAGRMDAVAAEIAAARPHVVGLQEVSRFALLDPATGQVVGGYDFLALLLGALEARGVHYRAAVENPNVMVALPAVIPGVGLRYVSLLDRDVILTRADVPVGATDRGTYAAHLAFPIGGSVLPVPRGWALAEVSFGGRDFAFATTHLEVERFPEIQEAQARELAARLADEPGVVVLAGDLNSDAYSGAYSDRPVDTQSYELLGAAGFVDVWGQVPAAGLGLTCCHDADLRDAVPDFRTRIDLLLVRSPFRPASGRLAGAVHALVVGEDPDDRTASGLWPSDHAGLVASLRLPEHALSAGD